MSEVSAKVKQLYDETLNRMRIQLKKEGRVLLNTSEIEELRSISPTLLTEQFERELKVGMEKIKRNSTYGASLKPTTDIKESQSGYVDNSFTLRRVNQELKKKGLDKVFGEVTEIKLMNSDTD